MSRWVFGIPLVCDALLSLAEAQPAGLSNEVFESATSFSCTAWWPLPARYAFLHHHRRRTESGMLRRGPCMTMHPCPFHRERQNDAIDVKTDMGKSAQEQACMCTLVGRVDMGAWGRGYRHNFLPMAHS